MRVERVLPLDPRRPHPVCIGGRRAVPAEDCGGPWAFLELRQHYSVVTIADRLLALVSPLIADSDDDRDEPVDDAGDERSDQPGDQDAHDHTEELATLLRWLEIDRFDRRAVNLNLAQLELTLARVAA